VTGATAFSKSASVGGINQDQRQKFLSSYPNRAGWISKYALENWTTPSVPRWLSDGMLLRAISGDIEITYGARAGKKSKFAVLDIDAGSPYHNAQALLELRKNLAIAYMVPIVYQSSESGGWHLYIFFNAEEDSEELQHLLKQWLKLIGYEIKQGVLEVFPSATQGLRLPLQKGFAWIEREIKRDQVDAAQALAMFLEDQEANVNDWQNSRNEIVFQLLAAESEQHQKAIAIDEGLDSFFYGRRNETIWQKGRELFKSGLQKKHQRHEAILCLGHYFWHGDETAGIPAMPGRKNDMTRYRHILNFLKEKHHGFCKHINRGLWKTVDQDIARAVKWRPTRDQPALQKNTPYMVTERVLDRQMAYLRQKNYVLKPEDLERANEKSSERSRIKIAAAVKTCLRTGAQITQSHLKRLTGCAVRTLKKHSDLWLVHSSFRLAAVISDLSLGGEGGASCSWGFVLNNSEFGVDQKIEDSKESSFIRLEKFERRSALAPVVALKDQSQIYFGQLTPCADRSKGEGEQLNGKRHSSLMPPSKHLSIATGSIAGAHFVCMSVSTCGINGQPPHEAWVPSHLILGNFCCGALRSLLLSLWRNRALAANCFIGAQYANLTASGEERTRSPPLSGVL
jgi:hypothetical protein